MARGSERPKKPSRKASRPSAEQILEATLELAEEEGWDALRLRRVADSLGCPLADVLTHYRDLDAVANAWFGRAWRAMLAPVDNGFYDLPAQERLYLLMLRWFGELAPHRRVTAQMLGTKLYGSHPHHWVPMIFNLSRTIHWLRDMAALDATGRRRQVEEVGLTALFLATLALWCRDGSEGQERTRRFLRRALERSDRLLANWPPADKRAGSSP